MHIESALHFKRHNDSACESNKCMENRRLPGALYIYHQLTAIKISIWVTKKSAKWVLSKISIPVIDIYVCAFCMIADGTVDVWSNHCLFTKQFSDTIMAKINQSQYTWLHDGSIPIFCHCRIHYNILQQGNQQQRAFHHLARHNGASDRSLGLCAVFWWSITEV